MTTSSTFPDDLMMEYDLLQFMENDDASARAMGTQFNPTSTSAAQFQFLNVDDLLGNAGIVLDSLDATPHQQQQPTVGTKKPTNSTFNTNTNTNECEELSAGASSLLDELFINGDELLAHLEAEAAAAESASSTQQQQQLNCDNATCASPCPSHCTTDKDCVSSPCPSMTSDHGHSSSSSNVLYATPPPTYFDEFDTMAKAASTTTSATTSISPACTPVSSAASTASGSGVTPSAYAMRAPLSHLHQQRRTSSHDGSTEGDEGSSSDGLDDKDDFGDDDYEAFGLGSLATPPQQQTIQQINHDAMELELQLEMDTDTEPIHVAHEDTGDEDDAMIQHNSDLLAKEAKYLEAQYDYLLSRAQQTTSRVARQSVKAKRRAREDQHQLVKKTNDNGLLTQLVSQQQVYMDNFKAMLAFAPVNDIRMALMTPIESYIHLGRDFDDRRRTILALRDEKLDMTYKYIEEKAQGIDPTQPYQYSDVFERFGKYYSVHFAVSKYEGVEVGQVVKVVYDQMAGHDESIAAAMGCLTIRESYDSIKCNFLHQRIVSSLKWSDEFEQGLPELESNSLFFCRFVGDTAVFATDYIDKDDLHPYESKDRIRKDVSSGVVLSAHVDADGKRSVIMKKFLMAKFHMFPHNLSDKLTAILFNKIPSVSQKVTKLIDEKLLASRGQPFVNACPAMHGGTTTAATTTTATTTPATAATAQQAAHAVSQQC